MDQSTKNYAESIKGAIDHRFKALDNILSECKELEESHQVYQKALKDLESGLDVVAKNYENFQKKAETALIEYSNLARKLSPYICDGYNTLEPLSIGIFGTWGSGKTRLLRTVKTLYEQTLSHTEDSGDRPLIVPIFFNAWRFEKEEHIIIPLFQTMLAELQGYPQIGRIRRIKERLSVLAWALVSNMSPKKTLALAKDFGLSALGSVVDMSGVWKKYKDKLSKLDPQSMIEEIIQSGYLNAVYIQIPQWIEKITIQDNVRFVFLIDDLDRCLPENALKMLESIKLFLDVPGCAFVLAVDDDVIERGVEHHYREYLFQSPHVASYADTHSRLHLPITGDEYLEKMVQLPFHIPRYDHEDLRAIITARFAEFADADRYTQTAGGHTSEDQRESDHKEVLDFMLKHTPKKPRKIIRAAELYLSKEALLKSNGIDVNPNLLIRLILLELFAPGLYRFMQERDFVDKFDILVRWGAKHKSLSNISQIKKALDSSPRQPQKDHEEDLLLVQILQSIYTRRNGFSLDTIFNKKFDEAALSEHIGAKPIPTTSTSTPQTRHLVAPIDWDTFFDRLLGADERAWRRAFTDDAFAQPGAVLDPKSFEELMSRLEERKELVRNPRWLEFVARHLSDDDFLKLLETYKPLEMAHEPK